MCNKSANKSHLYRFISQNCGPKLFKQHKVKPSISQCCFLYVHLLSSETIYCVWPLIFLGNKFNILISALGNRSLCSSVPSCNLVDFVQHSIYLPHYQSRIINTHATHWIGLLREICHLSYYKAMSLFCSILPRVAKNMCTLLARGKFIMFKSLKH